MSETKELSKAEITAQKELEYKSPYRWVALICIGLMHAVLMGTINQPAAFLQDIVGGMGASVTMYAQICTCGFLTGAIFSIPMGILADKWSVKGTMGVGLLISLVGSIWRVFAGGPWTLYFSCFVMGMGLAGMNANSPKFLKSWFGFRRVGTAMGIYVGCAGIGVAAFMAIGGQMDMHTTYIVNAVCVAVITVIWFLLAKTPKAVVIESENFSVASAKACLTNKHLMITALAMVLFMSVQVTYQAQAASAFQYVGIDAATAASWSSLASLVGIPANFLWTWLADKIGKIKAVLVPIVIIGLICFTAAWLLGANGPMLLLICCGYFFGFASCAFIKGCVGKIPSIKKEHMGTAGGIQTFFQNLGAYVIPSFILAPISGGNYTVMFLMVSGLMLLGLLVAAFLMPELGAKGKLAQENADMLDA